MRGRRLVCYSERMSARAETPRWVVDLENRVILECNEAAANLWGYPPEQMIGMKAERLVHVDELARARAVREEHVSGDAGLWKCVRRDCTVFYVHITVRRGVHEGRLCAMAEAAAS
jgi:PAS domain S-box-containing protein